MNLMYAITGALALLLLLYLIYALIMAERL